MAKTTSIINLLDEIKYQGKDALNIFKKYKILSQYANSTSFYFEYTIQENDRWDLLGNEFYGTPELWWMLALFNEIKDPFQSLIVGNTIKILEPRLVTHLLTELRRAK